jgi:hypothetical protein
LIGGEREPQKKEKHLNGRQDVAVGTAGVGNGICTVLCARIRANVVVDVAVVVVVVLVDGGGEDDGIAAGMGWAMGTRVLV